MKKLLLLSLIFEILSISSIPFASAGLANSPWPCMGHDLRRSGQSAYIGPQDNTLKWSFKPEGFLNYSSPVIDTDGTIYIGSGSTNDIIIIYAINPDGTLKWKHKTNYIDYSSEPSIGSDGTIYVGGSDKRLYAFDRAGGLKWCFEANGKVVSSPLVGNDGTIYVLSWYHNWQLYALTPDGSLKWKFLEEVGTYSRNLAIGADGTIYVGGDSLLAFDPNGKMKWHARHPINYDSNTDILYDNDRFSSPSIGTDGIIYVTNSSFSVKGLCAFDPNGTFLWSYEVGGECGSHSPSVSKDGTIYFGCIDKKLYALAPDGSLKWSYETGDCIIASPAIGADGTIYFSSYDGKFYSLNPDGTLKWKSGESENLGGASSPAIGADGTVYVVGLNKEGGVATPSHIFAFGASADTSSKNTNSMCFISNL